MHGFAATARNILLVLISTSVSGQFNFMCLQILSILLNCPAYHCLSIISFTWLTLVLAFSCPELWPSQASACDLAASSPVRTVSIRWGVEDLNRVTQRIRPGGYLPGGYPPVWTGRY